MLKSILSLPFFAMSFYGMAQTALPSSGIIQRFENVTSQHIAPRKIDVWLPQGYSPSKKYAVLYMHDGQMLFDSTHTWNHKEWMADEVMSTLLKKKKVKDCIVVGVWNTGALRHSEYFPEKPLAYLPVAMREGIITKELKGKAQSDEYLLFLTKELKPFIDSAFSTYTDRANTFIAGSSMGGLISMYALCEYPDIFGGAACISTHWTGSARFKDDQIPAAFNKYLEANLPNPAEHRIYFDYGDQGLDSLYEPYQLMINKTLQAKGYGSKNWITKAFPGEGHSEIAWSKRLDIPFTFLLGRKKR
jgi:predicted alpha/beta superfamily hydrolase